MTDTAQFTDKYEKSGRIAGLLVDRFLTRAAALVPREAEHILEIGCGAGYSTARLHAAHPNIVWEAADVDPDLVALARKRLAPIPVHVMSVYALPYANASLDCIVSLEVFEHLEHPRAALAELARVTKKSVIISVPREPLWRVLNVARGAYVKNLGNTPGHINHWSVRSFTKFVGREFSIDRVETPLPWILVRAHKRA